MLSMSQTKSLLDHLRQSCYQAYLQACVAVYSGMRLDEICRMKPMDIDWDAGILTINKVKSATKEFKTRYIFFKDDPMLEDALRQIDDRYNDGEGNVYFPVIFNRYQYVKATDALGLNKGIDPKDQVNRV